jgi:hypothetical protein
VGAISFGKILTAKGTKDTKRKSGARGLRGGSSRAARTPPVKRAERTWQCSRLVRSLPSPNTLRSATDFSQRENCHHIRLAGRWPVWFAPGMAEGMGDKPRQNAPQHFQVMSMTYCLLFEIADIGCG